MIVFTLEYRKAIAAMTADADNNLRKYKLWREEWEILEQLVKVLKVFKHATLFFSRATPNLATVIPAMDHIDEVLTTQAIDTNNALLPSIRAACSLARKTLNRYYERTDLSEMYRIAMVLHPRYELDYFKAHNWEDVWVDTAHTIVEDQFKRLYASLDVAPPDYEVPVAPKKVCIQPNIYSVRPF
ncbi:hypothetical protein FA13DRAFT_1633689 [Coprinellus micaceus]|uniref:hAT-like transposase RNase-H fold domain-containing protein n=1 Tax=Coprinellus micaceus TaxID=71717 RepID=A0A4Y7T219_COPMI|nr:hypothetical protein FA13DRAFT_1633689 [Coprinellus micaceus]